MTIELYRLILWIIFVGAIGTYLHSLSLSLSLSLSSSIVNFVVETYTLLHHHHHHHTYQCVQSCFPETRKQLPNVFFGNLIPPPRFQPTYRPSSYQPPPSCH
jgi:hypothetical protein